MGVATRGSLARFMRGDRKFAPWRESPKLALRFQIIYVRRAARRFRAPLSDRSRDERHQRQRSRLFKVALPAADPVPHARGPAAEGAGDSRPLAGDGPLQAHAGGRARSAEIRAARWPSLRQRQHPHRPRPEQDPQGHGLSLAGYARQGLELCAGLGLPRPAHRVEDRGRQLPLQGQAQARAFRQRRHDRLPQGMPRLCGALARHPTGGVQAPWRHRRLGPSLRHHEL